MNATRHGLVARTVVLPGVERVEAWEAHRAALVADLAPPGSSAPVAALAERAAELLWRLGRAGAAEAALAAFALAGAEREAVRSALAAEPCPGEGDPAGLEVCGTLADIEDCNEAARHMVEAAKLAVDGADDARLAPEGVKPLLRAMAVAAGVPLAGTVSVPGAARLPRGALRLRAWTVGAVRALAGDLAARGDRGANGAVVLAWAHTRALRARLRTLRVLADARRRLALAQGTAAVGPEVEAVRRHEAHLQRQLAGTLGMLDRLRACDAPVAEAGR